MREAALPAVVHQPAGGEDEVGRVGAWLLSDMSGGITGEGAFTGIQVRQALGGHVIKHAVARGKVDPGEVEDVTQEAFIKAYRALPSFRGDSAFYTWLYRIAINTAKNALVP